MKCIVFVILTVISLSQGFSLIDIKETEQRVVGGYETDIGKHGYQISLRKKSLFDPQDPYTHICGGSIYSEDIVITAAHCVIATVPSQLKIVAGSNFKSGNDGILVPVKEIVMHENYNPNTYNNDIAILVLGTSIPLNKFNMRSIELIDDTPTKGTETTIVGWGTLVEGGYSPNTLQEVKVPVVGQDECNEDYEGFITDYMLCAGLRNQGGKDACQGDSGGPLTIRNKLAGVVSWGNGCARPYFPGVYANVWTLKSWLLEKISHYE